MRTMMVLLLAAMGSACDMPSASGQIRIFLSGQDDSNKRSLQQSSQLEKDLAPLVRLLGALAAPQDYDDDATATSVFGGSPGGTGNMGGFVMLRFMSVQVREESSPCQADVNSHCQKIAEDAENPFPVRMCLQANLKTSGLSARCTGALAENPTVVEMCYTDIQEHCLDVEPGHSKIHKCLSNLELSGKCGNYFSKIGYPVSKKTSSPDYRSLLDRLAATKWKPEMKVQCTSNACKSFQQVAKGHYKWFMQNKMVAGIGIGFVFVCVLFAIDLSNI